MQDQNAAKQAGLHSKSESLGKEAQCMTDIKHRERGFTIVELMVTLVVVGILAAVALPSFKSLLGDSKIVATTNELVTSIHLARSEAVKRGVPVGVCPSTTPGAATAVCSDTAGWQSGWIAFADDNSNGQRDQPAEDLLTQQEARVGDFTFTAANSFSKLVYFSPDGTSINTSANLVAGTINVKYGSDEERNISISANGRVATVKP